MELDRHARTLVALLLLQGVIPGYAFAVTFADGLTHVIDASNSFPSEDVVVEDGPAQSVTTVSVVTGGEIGGTLSASGSSSIGFSGGMISDASSDLIAFDQAVVIFSGGNLGLVLDGENDLMAFGSSTVEITGGTIGNDLIVRDSSSVVVGGGLIGDDIEIVGAPTVTVAGGQIMRSLVAHLHSTVTITGGAFGENLSANGDSVVRYQGGFFAGNISANDNAIIEVSGISFTLPFGEISATSGTISGILADGTSINNQFSRAVTATIRLRDTTHVLPALDRIALSILFAVTLLIGLSAASAIHRSGSKHPRFQGQRTPGAGTPCGGTSHH